MKQILLKNITIPLGEPLEGAVELAKRRIAGILPPSLIRGGYLYKRSIDARKRDRICHVCSVLLEAERLPAGATEQKLARLGATLCQNEPLRFPHGSERLCDRPLVVGFGPGGMFAALILASQGYRPIVLERGEDVEARTKTVERFTREGVLCPASNVQFGAGGAGTFSDGKLVTRIHDPRLRFVLETLCEMGAPNEILVQAKPHIGTDRLRGVVGSIRDRILQLGGEIRFETCLRDLCLDRSGRVVGVETDQGPIACGAVILAIGHSARDTYAMLKDRGIAMERKPFSVGLRIEHLQEDIDRALYGELAGHKDLPKGEYALSKRVGEDAVYTFCMCPGGTVMASASEIGGVVTNGMSRYAREGKNANSALCVSVFPEDGIAFQRKLEQTAYAMGGGDYRAPIQTVGDFLSGKRGSEPSRVLPSYGEGRVTLSELSGLFPQSINEMLRMGLREFDGRLSGFAAPDAILTGVESRTSAPLRILRREDCTSLSCPNLYPCGEGAGYAGGISSAAVDGILVAERLIARYSERIGD